MTEQNWGVFDGWGDMKDLLNRFKNESSEKQYNDFAMRWNDFEVE